MITSSLNPAFDSLIVSSTIACAFVVSEGCTADGGYTDIFIGALFCCANNKGLSIPITAMTNANMDFIKPLSHIPVINCSGPTEQVRARTQSAPPHICYRPYGDRKSTRLNSSHL